MANSRPSSSLLLLLLAVLSGILSLARASAPGPSPEASPALICHTSNPDECYPRVFQPTDEFQLVRDDQQLPKGLHVRLNVVTGKREAKINVPDEELDPSLHGLPVEQALLVVEPEQPEQPDETRGPLPKGALGSTFDPVGKIKPPQGHEATNFAEAFRMLKSGVGVGAGERQQQRIFDKALEGMEELAHDIFYGLQIAEDADVVKALVCLMGAEQQEMDPHHHHHHHHDDGDGDDGGDDGGDDVGGVPIVPRDQQAAAILAGSLSNNPAALKEVAKIWDGMMGSTSSSDDATSICPGSSRRVRDSFEASLAPRSPSRLKAKVAAVKGLLKDASIRAHFLQNQGMQRLLLILSQEGAEWAPAQRRVGQLVVDTFLDEDMGAQLGEWPGPRTARASGEALCAGPPPSLADGCWEYQVARLAGAHSRSSGADKDKDKDKDQEHWSRDLGQRLARARARARAREVNGETGAPASHEEL